MGKRFIRILSAFLVFLMVFGCFPAVVSSADLVVTIVFSDVKNTDWFYDYVMALSEKGAVNGYPDGTFKPSGEITCAEYTKILLTALSFNVFSDDQAKTNSNGKAETPSQDSGSVSTETPVDTSADTSAPQPESDDTLKDKPHWAKSYIDTAVRDGIITEEDTLFAPDEPIVRSLMVKMLISALGIDPVILTSADKPFADEADEYAETAWLNYLVGGYIENEARYFGGDRHTTRAEASAVIMRACDYINDPVAFKESELIKFASVSAVNTKLELINYFCYMSRIFSESVTLHSKKSYDEWTEIYQTAAYIYPEYIMSRGYDCKYYKNSDYFDITFLYESDQETMLKITAEADSAAQSAADMIKAATDDVFEQIKMIHDYIIEKCVYDYDNYINNTVPYEAYTSYGAIVKGSALCQGYSAAFNLICKKLGIESYGVTGTSPTSTDFHMWNVVRLDGLMYFIDLTYDDPYSPDGTESIEYTSFMLTMQQFKINGYTWDDDAVNDVYFNLIY